ncbi:LysR family transcriptional regulator [Uruburuella testudinis]|uniref:LysR family transcriptional regulator n=1 Tax=Uruburuella testudinis TaxID=1282863 RepID=A0ABY4DQA9_9NEIS|nr:LysR family transcriptional regulator [Uruburuella testudinis]UOO80895.1 LysR family transcriptional regulator [Uruburuella testudinis]
MAENLNDLRTFIAVAQTGSFTKAAAQTGVSQSAVSHSMRALESRLGVKLFHRTTRSISTTEAGERLYRHLLPLFENIDQEISNVLNEQENLRGSLRVNGSIHVFESVLWAKFEHFLQVYPDVSLELVAENRFIDIVAERFDAGIRLGDDVAKDMIAVRLSPDMQMCVAAAPAYLAQYGTPQTPADLSAHQCLAMRLPTHGGLLAWEFTNPDDGKTVKIRPQGRFTANSGFLLQNAAAAGHGLMWTPRDSITEKLSSGRLKTVLDDWAITYPGYYLYYPNRRSGSPLLQALVEVLRE